MYGNVPLPQSGGMVMRAVQFTSVILVMLLAAPGWAAAPAYQIIDRIKVGDGRFDYAVFDASTSRVYMSRSFTTTVIDVNTNKVSQLDSAANGHMTLPIPGTTLAVVPRAQGMELPIPRDAPGIIRIVDLKTDSVVADLPAGINPDGAVYDPFSKLVFVMNHVSGDSTVVDPVKHAVVATIPVGGTLEFPASNGAGKVYVNVQDQSRIAVIDVKTMKVTGFYPLTGCQSPTGLAYIPVENFLVSACGNGVAKVIAADTGKEVASIKIGRGPDAVKYDPNRHVVLIPSGRDGELDIISVADPANISVVQRVPTQVGCRTGTVDPNTGRFYTVASRQGPVPAGGGRAAPLPGSFEVLVIAP
jgi:YVTN family beta-propeller protein